MDKATLVGFDLEAGRELLRRLDQTEFKVVAALWLYLPEFGEWRLWIASPVVDEEGIEGAYRRIQAILLKNSKRIPIDLAQITAVSPKDPFIRGLRRAFGKTASVEGMRLGGQPIGDRFIVEAYVYRIR